MNSPQETTPRLLFLGPEDTWELELIRERLGREGTPRRFEVVVIEQGEGDGLRAAVYDVEPTLVHVGPVARAVDAALPSILEWCDLWGLECVVFDDRALPGSFPEFARSSAVAIRVDRRLAGEPARRFLAGFYCGVGMGLDYEAAFALGRLEVDPVAPPGPSRLRLTKWRRGITGGPSANVVPETLPPDVPRPPDRPAPAPLPGYRRRTFRVWYGTDRAPVVDGRGQLTGYSSARDHALHVGHCDVEIPTAHAFGSLGSSWLRRFLTREEDRVALRSVAELDRAAFWGEISGLLAARQDRDAKAALVFIHGFRVSFEASARQAAQIGFDLKVPGVVAFYSWPSQGHLLDYLADESTIRDSAPFLRDFLADFAARSGASRIDILAHSMGNRGLAEALGQLAATSAGGATIGQVIHAAPDVDADEFRRLAGSYARHTGRTTLYASPDDVAVGASRFLHRFDRAGYTPPVTVVPGVDTVEVLDIDPTLLGHGYFAEAEPLLYDLKSLLQDGAPPPCRLRLEGVPEDAPAYWRLGKGLSGRAAANVRRAAPALIAAGAVGVVAALRPEPRRGLVAVAVGVALAGLAATALPPFLVGRLVPRPLKELVASPRFPVAAWLGALGAILWMLRPLMRRLFGIALATAVLAGLAATAPGRDDGPVAAALAKVDPARIEATVRRLADFPTRHTLSPANLEAADWLRDEFKKIGYDDVQFHEFRLGKVARRNVVCTKPGREKDRFVLVCAHLDSRATDLGAPDSRAPGADDNASGVAAVLELARALMGVETPWSVRFVAFSGEEQGLVGSSAYAGMANDQKMKIRLVLNLDMIGHPADPSHPAIIVERDGGNARAENDAPSAAVADRMERLAAGAGLGVTRGVIDGSDYMPFERFGFVCVGLFDGADHLPFYHSRDDTPDKVDVRYCASATRLALATLLDLAAGGLP